METAEVMVADDIKWQTGGIRGRKQDMERQIKTERERTLAVHMSVVEC